MNLALKPTKRILELSLIENIQREELNPIEEANAFRSLSERRSLTQDEIAQRVGKDRSTIANALRLLKLPAEIQRLLEEEKLSTGHARALLSVESIDQQIALADEIASKTMSVRETERLVKRTAPAVKRRDPAVNAEAPNVAAAEAKLGKKLGAPVKIKIGKRGGTLEIKFASNDDLARLFDGLMQVRI